MAQLYEAMREIDNIITGAWLDFQDYAKRDQFYDIGIEKAYHEAMIKINEVMCGTVSEEFYLYDYENFSNITEYMMFLYLLKCLQTDYSNCTFL